MRRGGDTLGERRAALEQRRARLGYEPLWYPEDVTLFLGISRSTLDTLDAVALPVTRIGGQRRYCAEDVLRYVEQCRKARGAA